MIFKEYYQIFGYAGIIGFFLMLLINIYISKYRKYHIKIIKSQIDWVKY
jgi:uncharacterized membrane protein